MPPPSSTEPAPRSSTLVVSLSDTKPLKAFLLSVVELYDRMRERVNGPYNETDQALGLRMSTSELEDALVVFGLEVPPTYGNADPEVT